MSIMRSFLMSVLLCFSVLSNAQSTQSMAIIEGKLLDIEDRLRQLTGVIEEIKHGLDMQSSQSSKLYQDLCGRFDEVKKAVEKVEESIKNSQKNITQKKQTTPTEPASSPKKNVESAKDNATATINEAKALLTQGSYKSAQNRLNSYINKNPNSSSIQSLYYWLGEACFAGKSFNEASFAFVKAYKVDQKNDKAPLILLKLAKTLNALGKKKDAAVALDKLLADYKDISPRLKKMVQDEKLKTK